MKRAVLVVLAVALLLVLSGCSGKITSGEVVEKSYTPAYSTVRIIPLFISNGKTSRVMPIPYVYHYSDKWEVTIAAWDEKEKKMQTATYRVTEEVYEAVEIGAEFVYDKDMKPIEPEYTRERK